MDSEPLVNSIPDASAIRDRLSAIAHEARILRQLLRVAERKARTDQSRLTNTKGDANAE